ncbi:transmembrane protease serine 9-like [Rhinoraja longicauda]
MLQTALVALVATVLAGQGYDCTEIIGGHEAKPYSKSFMVSIQANNKHVCGGSLIHVKWVLTAASCLQLVKKKRSIVIIGLQSTQKKDKTEQKISIKNFFPYPEYKNALDNDLMLLELGQAANIKSKEILQLPTSPKDPKSGLKCSLIGWGQTNSKDKSRSEILKEAEATVMDRKTCNSNKYYNRSPVITDNMICATDKKGRKDSCLVDAGDPLMCKKKAMSWKKEVVGVSTARKECGNSKKPGIYVRLTDKYLSWIKEKIGVVNFSKAVEQSICVKIIGGHDAKPGSGSYVASIQTSNEHFCGGILIEKRWVLTSVNCILKQMSVVIGTHSLKDKKKAQTFKVINVIKHPKYDSKTERNNLALLKLDKAAKLNKLVKILPLPKSAKDIKPGTKCKVLGWGQTTADDTDPSDTLQETTVTIIDRKTCNNQKYYKGKPVITDDMICAGDKTGGQAKMCRGDAGGPLICKSSFLKKNILSGIAIFGMGCEVKFKPGIYTHLSNKYLQWIKKTIKSKTNDISMDQTWHEQQTTV